MVIKRKFILFKLNPFKLDLIEIIKAVNKKNALIGSAEGKKTNPIKNRKCPLLINLYLEKKRLNLFDILINI